jgi:hypothetical protein
MDTSIQIGSTGKKPLPLTVKIVGPRAGVLSDAPAGSWQCLAHRLRGGEWI